jgi:ABC-type phosphate transport system substrate-binding protein
MLWLGPGSSSAASDDAFVVIVRADNPATALDHAFLRGVFLRTVTTWKGGGAARPVDLSKRSPVRDRFSRDVLGMTRAQVTSYWLQRIFSGTAVPPPEVSSESAAVAYVRANQGGVAYVAASADSTGTKIVAVR